MDNLVVWLIIIAFYAPLHYLLPVLVLFITGRESETVRKGLIRRALIDSTLSMTGAFAIAIYLVEQEMMSVAMLILLVSMLYPFIGIWRHRCEITAEVDEADRTFWTQRSPRNTEFAAENTEAHSVTDTSKPPTGSVLSAKLNVPSTR